MKERREKIIARAKRVVIKVGSAVVAGRAVKGEDVFTRLAREINLVRDNGREVVLVSSGAIAMGMERLGRKARPVTIPEFQAVAAVGQPCLMARYEKAFDAFGVKTAQVLLTHDDLGDRKRFLNARNTMLTLLELGIVPIINENDTVAVDEIKFGDNDTISALVTNLVEADLLVVLTNVDGIYDRDPEKEKGSAKRFAFIDNVDSLKIEWTGGGKGPYGTGGVESKVDAARKAAHFGTATVVASGLESNTIGRVLNGEDVGTFFFPLEDRLTSKKHWIAFSTRPTGRVFIDDGAKGALVKHGKSLLPAGITKVDGNFETGEVIHCVDGKGMEFARGISNYSSREIESIRGHKSSEIEGILGYRANDEVIHRDNLVLL